jgi:proline iminopeptidase
MGIRVLALATAFSFAVAAPAAPQLSHPEPEWYLRTGDRGCRLFVQEYGRGRDTAVVLHGGPGAEHSYLFDAFSGLERQYHLVFYDQRGSLRSPCSGSELSFAKHVEDLERLRVQLRLERMTLVGHSAGTTLAMLYLDRHPDRVRGLVLVSVSLPYSDSRTDEERALRERQERAKQAFAQRPEVAAELRRHGLDRDTSQLSDEARTARWRVQFAAANIYHVDRWHQLKGGQAFWNPRAAQAGGESMPKQYDFLPALRAHPCAVWVLAGDHDFGPITVEVHRQWVREVPNARLVIIERAGHAAWIDAPAAFRRHMVAALANTTRCRGGPPAPH